MPAYMIEAAVDMLPLCSNEEGVVAAQNSFGDFILSTLDVGLAELLKIVERAGATLLCTGRVCGI